MENVEATLNFSLTLGILADGLEHCSPRSPLASCHTESCGTKELRTMGLPRSSGDRNRLFSFGDRDMSKESLIKVGKTLVNRMSVGEVSEVDALQAE